MKHKHADLIHAWADGAQIEWKDRYGQWHDIGEPLWSEKHEYRIKPEPKPDIVHKTKIVLFEPYKDSVGFRNGLANIQLTFDGETWNLKSAEVLK